MKLFDEKFYICGTRHNCPDKNEIPCQAACNKMALYHIPEELKNLKVLIS